MHATLSAEDAFGSHACRAMLAAQAMYAGNWRLNKDTARLFLSILLHSSEQVYPDTAAPTANLAVAPEPERLQAIAVLQASALGFLAVQLDKLAVDATRRKAGAHDMQGNCNRALLSRTVCDARCLRVAEADDPELVTCEEILSLLLLGNEARCCYARSRDIYFSGSPLADEADMWISLLEVVDKLSVELTKRGVKISTSVDALPLSGELWLDEFTRRQVSAVKYKMDVPPPTSFVHTVTEAGEQALVALDALSAALREHAEVPFLDDDAEEKNKARHEDAMGRWVRLIYNSNPGRAYEQLRNRFIQLQTKGDLRAAHSASACARAADAMWTLEYVSDSCRAVERVSHRRFQAMVSRKNNNPEDVAFVLHLAILPNLETLKYPSRLLEIAVELAAITMDKAEDAAAQVLQALEVADSLERLHSDVKSRSRVTVRLLYLMALFCQLYHCNREGDQSATAARPIESALAAFKKLNGAIREGRWAKPERLEASGVNAYRLVFTLTWPQPGAFLLPVRRRFSRNAEADAEAEQPRHLITPDRVFGKVVHLPRDASRAAAARSTAGLLLGAQQQRQRAWGFSDMRCRCSAARSPQALASCGKRVHRLPICCCLGLLCRLAVPRVHTPTRSVCVRMRSAAGGRCAGWGRCHQRRCSLPTTSRHRARAHGQQARRARVNSTRRNNADE